MLRSKSAVLTLALMGVAIAGCTPAQPVSVADPCQAVMLTGDAILDGSDDKDVVAVAAARHIIEHATCYGSETIAAARVALAKAERQEQKQPYQPPPPCRDGVYYC